MEHILCLDWWYPSVIWCVRMKSDQHIERSRALPFFLWSEKAIQQENGDNVNNLKLSFGRKRKPKDLLIGLLRGSRSDDKVISDK